MIGSDSNRESILVNPVFTVALGYDPVIAHSTKYTYNDHRLESDNTGRCILLSIHLYSLIV